MNAPDPTTAAPATYVDGDGKVRPDRRANRRLREIFDQACDLVAPFFERRNEWSGQSLELLAFRAVRDAFPELSSEEVHIFIVAASRFYHERAHYAD